MTDSVRRYQDAGVVVVVADDYYKLAARLAASEAERDSLRANLAKLEALVNQHCTTCIGCKGIGFVGGYISIEDGITVDEREPCPSCAMFLAALQSSEKGL